MKSLDRHRRHKGTGLLHVVKAIKANPKARAAVPSSLLKYLEEPILISDWYSEVDYEVLLEILAESIPRAAIGVDVWTFFGQHSAQRDLAGLYPGATGTEAGIYRRFMEGGKGDPASLFRRAATLWSVYHDTGRMSVWLSPRSDACVLVRLHDFRFPVRGMIQLQAAYFVEFGRLAGLQIRSRITRTTMDGDPYCEWEYTVEHTPENVASLATLPVAPP